MHLGHPFTIGQTKEVYRYDNAFGVLRGAKSDDSSTDGAIWPPKVMTVLQMEHPRGSEPTFWTLRPKKLTTVLHLEKKMCSEPTFWRLQPKKVTTVLRLEHTMCSKRRTVVTFFG